MKLDNRLRFPLYVILGLLVLFSIIYYGGFMPKKCFMTGDDTAVCYSIIHDAYWEKPFVLNDD